MTRHFIPALLFAFSRLVLAWSTFEMAMLDALKALTAFYGELEPHRALMCLPSRASRALLHHTLSFIQTMNWLATHQDGTYFNITPKLHYMRHLALQARVFNPLWVHCYGEEDLIGKIIEIAHAASKGRRQAQLPRVVLERYRALLSLVWGGHL